MKKKIVIIGGGIAGLSAGVYALRCGFEAAVLESHSIAGGNCTSWKRGDYLFEGGMHWLTGSGEREILNKCWHTVGALEDGVKVTFPEPFIEYDYNGTPVKFYRDVDKTEKHWLELSPEDEKEIKAFCGNIRKIKNLAIPVMDIKGVKVTKKMRPPMSLIFSGMSAMKLMRKFAEIDSEAYAKRFKHEGIRELLRASTGGKSGVLPIFFTMGILARGDGGFPEGGSLPFAGRIAAKFQALGGELIMNTRAEKVVIENGRATGVMANGKLIPADAVIVTADTMLAHNLFDVELKAPWYDEMRKHTEPTMCVFVSLGINADLSAYPHGLVVKPDKPLELSGRKYEYLSLNNYAADRDYSPEGKSAVTLVLDGDTWDYWKKAKEEGRYKEEKAKLAETVIAALAERIPEIEGSVEVCDVATPLTYERYCGNWKGSWMSEVAFNMNVGNGYPAAIDGLSGVYFAGQRMMPPGGLPVALMTGRTAVQYLCRDTGTVFVSEE